MRRDEAYLLDIVLAARRTLRFAEGVSWEKFQQDDLLQNAVIRPLEIIGEAARLVSEETKLAHPEIPWEQMVGLRNRLIHEYFRINLPTVWQTIQENLPGLITLIEPLIPPEDQL